VRLSRFHLTILFILIWLAIPTVGMAQSDGEPVVRAILFYSPTCPHCHLVITETVIPLTEEYGDQLQVLGIDISQAAGNQVFQMVMDKFGVAHEQRGVPTLIVGDKMLVGSVEIPKDFPGIVEKGLEADGIDWPDIPGLSEIIPPETGQEPTGTGEAQTTDTPTPDATASSEATATAVPTQTPVSTPTPAALALGKDNLPPSESQTPPLDPVGLSLAGILMAGMVVALTFTVVQALVARRHLFRLNPNPGHHIESWIIPLLSLIGLAAATYLAYVEINQVEAVCGPVGECNIVQSSPYARILGIPIAVLGMVYYVTIILFWGGQKFLSGWLRNLDALALLGLSIFGTLFSIYLTWLELFAIHAVCAWCMTSALISTLLMLLVVIPLTAGRPSGEGQTRPIHV
jgi:uncharacterized membrane protein